VEAVARGTSARAFLIRSIIPAAGPALLADKTLSKYLKPAIKL
jgi:hypothetical protein